VAVPTGRGFVIVGGHLIAIGGELVALRGALIDVGGRLIEIRTGLITVRAGLIAVGERLGIGVAGSHREPGVIRAQRGFDAPDALLVRLTRSARHEH
jgi:hypothetical protein